MSWTWKLRHEFLLRVLHLMSRLRYLSSLLKVSDGRFACTECGPYPTAPELCRRSPLSASPLLLHQHLPRSYIFSMRFPTLISQGYRLLLWRINTFTSFNTYKEFKKTFASGNNGGWLVQILHGRRSTQVSILLDREPKESNLMGKIHHDAN